MKNKFNEKSLGEKKFRVKVVSSLILAFDCKQLAVRLCLRSAIYA